MQRYTVKDVRDVFDTFRELAVRLDVDGAPQWKLREGSAVNGRPYRIYRVDPSDGGQWEPIPFPNYLGATARESWERLSAYLTGMRAVIRTLGDRNVEMWPRRDEPTV